MNITNVKDLGAVGDGITDDTDPFQTALNMAETLGSITIYIPDGTYSMTSELLIYSNTQIICSDNAIIVRRHNGYIMINGNRNSGYTKYNGHGNIRIEGGTWDGNANQYKSTASIFHIGHGENISFNRMKLTDPANSHHVEFNACKKIRVDNCNFLGMVGTHTFTEAIQLDLSKKDATILGADDDTPCKDVVIQNCYFGNSNTTGSKGIVRGIGSHTATSTRPHSNILIKNNIFDGCESWAIRAYNWQNTTIESNKIINCSSGINLRASITGVDTEDPNGLQKNEIFESAYVVDNVIDGGLQGGRAIEAYGEDNIGRIKNVHVMNNRIKTYESINDAILFSNAEHCTAIGNRIYSINKMGISVKNSSFDIVIQANVIDLSGEYGIGIVDSYYVNVNGNNIRRSYLNGIYISAGESHIINANIVTGANGIKGDARTYNNIRTVSEATRITINGNVIRNYSTTHVATYGIYVTSTCNDVVITSNNAKGFSINDGSGTNLDNNGNLT